MYETITKWNYNYKQRGPWCSFCSHDWQFLRTWTVLGQDQTREWTRLLSRIYGTMDCPNLTRWPLGKTNNKLNIKLANSRLDLINDSPSKDGGCAVALVSPCPVWRTEHHGRLSVCHCGFPCTNLKDRKEEKKQPVIQRTHRCVVVSNRRSSLTVCWLHSLQSR